MGFKAISHRGFSNAVMLLVAALLMSVFFLWVYFSPIQEKIDEEIVAEVYSDGEILREMLLLISDEREKEMQEQRASKYKRRDEMSKPGKIEPIRIK